jgi:Histidine kinase
MGADETGEWNSRSATFSFTIAVPWWQTIWFRALAVASLVCLVYYFVRRRIKVIRHEAQLKQQIAETEMMALRTQMNPHFIFNSINSKSEFLRAIGY